VQVIHATVRGDMLIEFVKHLTLEPVVVLFDFRARHQLRVCGPRAAAPRARRHSRRNRREGRSPRTTSIATRRLSSGQTMSFSIHQVAERERVPFEERKFDLSRLFIDIYGVSYIGHPRLERLLQKNRIEPLNFLNGAQEAEAFANRNYVGLHQSTLRKVDVIANIAGRAHDRNLKVDTRGGKCTAAVCARLQTGS
jgi:hypothetical protein